MTSDLVVERYACRRCADTVDAPARDGPPRYRLCRGRDVDVDPQLASPRPGRRFCDFQRMPPPPRVPSRAAEHALQLDLDTEPVAAACSCEGWRRALGRDELRRLQLDTRELTEAFLEGVHAEHAQERARLRADLGEHYY